MNYEKLREKYLDKLKATSNVLEQLPEYKQFGIFESEILNELESIEKINTMFLDKLNNGKIEVAIVGMENTGKSTFANALIKLKEAFPTGSIRTTFTSTRLKYGPTDKAIVEFFETNAFNDMFIEMLKKVKYPEYKNANFKVMNIESYKEYFDGLATLEPDTYKAHNGSTNEDIKAILIGKDEILKYLDNNIKEFDKQAIQNQELKKFITDKYIARTVKKVELELSEFEDTKEMVLYDVPGFNSITEKHKAETKKSLNSADAVILIKNIIENSQITSEEKTMLSSYDDNSGIVLSEKLFVFGTKIDRANTKVEASTNITTLKDDLKTNLNVEDKRIFIGSPYAYMQHMGLEDGSTIKDILIQRDMSEYITSIDNMKDAIKDFYKNEAFLNIQRQINKNIEKLKNILDMITENDTKLDQELSQIDQISENLKLDFFTDKFKKFKSKLPEINTFIKQEINSEKYFSNELRNQIDTMVEQVTIEELIKENELLGNPREAFSPDAVNNNVRKKLSKQILKDFVKLTVSLADDKETEYNIKILNTDSEI